MTGQIFTPPHFVGFYPFWVEHLQRIAPASLQQQCFHRPFSILQARYRIKVQWVKYQLPVERELALYYPQSIWTKAVSKIQKETVLTSMD